MNTSSYGSGFTESILFVYLCDRSRRIVDECVTMCRTPENHYYWNHAQWDVNGIRYKIRWHRGRQVVLCHVIDPNRPVNVIDDELLPYALAVGLPQLKGLVKVLPTSKEYRDLHRPNLRVPPHNGIYYNVEVDLAGTPTSSKRVTTSAGGDI
ncbi:hypothetical protein F5887DRAFT_1161494 [Amanita rubescens]|nr:hypothetical protein F5887DRAFT_1161494 [Amanita rubescens]